jgi:hypothetical protein
LRAFGPMLEQRRQFLGGVELLMHTDR